MECGRDGPQKLETRSPDRLVVEARIEWLAASQLHVAPAGMRSRGWRRAGCPAPTHHKLNRAAALAPWERQAGEPGAPWEWKRQPFYPKVHGRWCTAETASYYNKDAWTVFNHHIRDAAPPPGDPALEHHAQLLGIATGAGRREINAAFRVMAKKLHPDFGGTHDQFQRLLDARDSLLVKCQKV